MYQDGARSKRSLHRHRMDAEKTYLPAASRDWLLPLYDPVVKLLGAGRARTILLDEAAVRPGNRLLDIGCGTGTFATLIKRLYPDVDATGLDPDPKALERAKRKAERLGVMIRWDQGFSNELPYPDTSFDHVFSTFMFHHLQSDQKEGTLREVRRVLAPAGSFHLLDFLVTERDRHRGLAPWSHHLNDNSEEQILNLMNGTGFDSCKKTQEGALLFGTLRTGYFLASAPVAQPGG